MRRFWFFVWTFMSPIIMIIIFFGSVVNEIVQPLQYTVFDTVTKVRERGRGEREDRGSCNISYLYICPLNVFICKKISHTQCLRV